MGSPCCLKWHIVVVPLLSLGRVEHSVLGFDQLLTSGWVQTGGRDHGRCKDTWQIIILKSPIDDLKGSGLELRL